MIIEKIKKDLKEALLERDENKKNILRVILSESQRIGKDVSDDEVYNIIKKLMDNAKQINNKEEIDILNKYMPKLLEEDELNDIIRDLIKKEGYSSMKDIGKIMSYLKSNYGSSYDAKIASTIAKKNLN